jgi:hypothetical protein
MRDFRQIQVWVKAHALTLEIYRVTAQFPRDERYGLTSQMRRSSASIPTNIAEGFGRGGDAELARFLQIGMAQPRSSNIMSSSQMISSYLLFRSMIVLSDESLK